MTVVPEFASFQAAGDALSDLASTALAQARTKGLEDAGRILRRECEATISFTDHSLADLARMDHPYARRHGTILVHRDRHWAVHTHTGTMKRALLGSLSGEGDWYEVWIDLGEAPHAKWVIGGTKWMLPRDPLWQTAQDIRVQRLMMKAFTRAFGKEYRTKAVLRFTPRTTSGGTVAPSGYHSRI
jgi:hypothetical protein